MMWLTFRQFRVSTMVAVVGLAALAVALGITGPSLADLYDSSGIAACKADQGDCRPLIDALTREYSALQWVGAAVLLFVPGVLGVFWGAPLVARELESGTYRLAWTQSTTRTRWLAVKVIVVGLATVAVAGSLSLMLTWWSVPLDAARGNRFEPDVFSERGVAPMGYAAFAFALGLASGLVVRRTLAAMGATLVVFAAVWFSVMLWVRPHYESPVVETSALTPLFPPGATDSGTQRKLSIAGPGESGDWVLSEVVIDPAGDETNSIRCGPEDSGCLVGYQHRVTYQPASRFWTFQWIEAGLYAGLAAVLVGFSFWWVRYRVT